MKQTVQRQTIAIFWQAAWRYKFKTLFSMTNPVLSVVTASFIGPYIISRFLSHIQAGDTITLSTAMPLILSYGAAAIYGDMIGWRLTLFSTWKMETAAQRNLLQRVFDHLTNQSVNFHANRFGGSLVSQTNKLNGAFERFWDTIIFQLIPSITSVIAAVVILSFVFWQYAAILFALSLTFIVTILVGSRFMAHLNVKEAQASTKVTGRLADAMTNILAIKSHGQEDYEKRSYGELTETWRQKSLDSMWGFLKVSTIYSFLIVVLNVSALIAAVWATEHRIVPIAAVYLSITYTFIVARQLWEMNNIMRNFNRVMGDANDMTEILQIKPEIVDRDEATLPKISRGDIEFKNVSFTHPDSSDHALFSNVNLRIKPGEKIGLVGHSGGGKTTLSKLIMRFMDVQKGQILIDEQDITEMSQSALRKMISYVPQEPILFHRTLRENIRYGKLEASDREVEIVSRLAHAEDFIKQLPKVYDTLVGERGVKLSGGQRQRVVIARAMLKNAPILILDEATSALDSESEELIQDALWKLMEGRTAIVIAHRLSTIQKMDRIIVLKEGKIVEEGTHRELIRQGGTYADLWSRQSGGFLEET